jgi:hypothetical protein
MLGGWLLTLPPVEKASDKSVGVRGWQARTNAAMAEWEQRAAFDTAAACEAERASYLKDSVGENPLVTVVSDRLSMVAAQAVAARCVPSEHVYPAKEPAQK